MNKKEENLIENLFDENWYTNVAKAIDFTLSNSSTLDLSEEEIVNDILEYNITRVLEEKIIADLVNTLPRSYDWKEKSITEIIESFNDIISSCNICKNFKKYTAKVILNDSGVIKNQLLFLKEAVNSDYKDLFVTFTPMKTKNHYKLEIKRIN